MTIEYKDYKAVCNDSRFDLYQVKTMVAEKDTKKFKKGDTYEKEITIGYGYSFESLLRRIVEAELERKHKVITIREYIEEFGKEMKKLKKTLE